MRGRGGVGVGGVQGGLRGARRRAAVRAPGGCGAGFGRAEERGPSAGAGGALCVLEVRGRCVKPRKGTYWGAVPSAAPAAAVARGGDAQPRKMSGPGGCRSTAANLRRPAGLRFLRFDLVQLLGQVLMLLEEEFIGWKLEVLYFSIVVEVHFRVQKIAILLLFSESLTLPMDALKGKCEGLPKDLALHFRFSVATSWH